MILGRILFSVFGRTEHTLSKATDGWGEGWGGCSSPHSRFQAAIQKAFKRLEKWATENSLISKASPNSCIWKRIAPRSSTGQGLTG